jgi:hypothetical protein
VCCEAIQKYRRERQYMIVEAEKSTANLVGQRQKLSQLAIRNSQRPELSGCLFLVPCKKRKVGYSPTRKLETGLYATSRQVLLALSEPN